MNSVFDLWKVEQVKEYLKGTTWRVAANEKGRTYYYDKVKKTSQWVKPDDIKEFEDTLSYELFHSQQRDMDDATMDQATTIQNEEKIVKNVPTPQKAPIKVESPKILSKEELERILERRDSILECGAIAAAKNLYQDHNVPPVQIVQQLAKNYHGYPAMTRMLVEWIKMVKILELKPAAPKVTSLSSHGSSSDLSATSTTHSAASVRLNSASLAHIAHFGSDHYGEEVISPYFADLIKLRFNRKAADSLVVLPEHTAGTESPLPVIPAYMHTLLQNPTYSAALQELYTVHDQSTLLRAVCTGNYTVSSTADSADVSPAGHPVTSAGYSSGDSRPAFEVLSAEVVIFERVEVLLRGFVKERLVSTL